MLRVRVSGIEIRLLLSAYQSLSKLFVSHEPLKVRLLGRERANNRNPKFTMAVRLIHAKEPQPECAERDQQAKGKIDEDQVAADTEKNSPDDAPGDIEDDEGHAERHRLHSVKSNKPIVFVWFKHQEDDSGDKAD
jgi:hypothetical protein